MTLHKSNMPYRLTGKFDTIQILNWRHTPHVTLCNQEVHTVANKEQKSVQKPKPKSNKQKKQMQKEKKAAQMNTGGLAPKKEG